MNVTLKSTKQISLITFLSYTARGTVFLPFLKAKTQFFSFSPFQKQICHLAIVLCSNKKKVFSNIKKYKFYSAAFDLRCQWHRWVWLRMVIDTDKEFEWSQVAAIICIRYATVKAGSGFFLDNWGLIVCMTYDILYF